MSRYTQESKLIAVNCRVESSTGEGTTFPYVFRTNLADGSGNDLGHKPGVVSNKIVKGGVFGANAPKPKTATKNFGGTRASESSFCSTEAELLAATKGWTLTSSKEKNFNRSSRQIPVFVQCLSVGGAVKYGWLMNFEQWDLVKDFSGSLGIEQIPEGKIPKQVAIFGVNAPKPHRVKRAIIAGKLAPILKEGDSLSGEIQGYFGTFCAHDKIDTALKNGWNVIAPPAVIQGITVL